MRAKDTGRERAKAAGVRFGRKHKLDAYQRSEVLKRLAAGEPMSTVAKSYRVSVPTLWRLQEAA
jgi:DNA invertase Pin-like site-specific DNA recombinase